ncbi:MAG: hypothetical protein ACRC68_12560 [Clostridium sp.]
MNSTLKTLIYVVLGFMVISLVVSLFFSLVPYLLLIGLILFVYSKIKGYFILKKRGSSQSSYGHSYKSEEKTNYSTQGVEEDVVADVIDVDYKEVD